jgi:hypothetical protein
MSEANPEERAPVVGKAAPDRIALFVFGATICLGASLVSLLQPMAAKMVLPVLGGSPAVWNTPMLLFHTLDRRLPGRTQPPLLELTKDDPESRCQIYGSLYNKVQDLPVLPILPG